MVITQLFGGMGNQMFQYAAGLGLAHHRNTYQKLSLRWFQQPGPRLEHERYALTCFNICEVFATAQELAAYHGRVPNAGLKRRVFEKVYPRFRTKPTFYEEGAAFNPAFFDQSADAHLIGYFQTERYFAAIAPLVRAHFSFRFPADRVTRELLAKIEDGPSAFVHFRRGDYVNDERTRGLFGSISLRYYKRAVEELRERVPDVRLFIFSDDLEYARAHFRPEIPHTYVDRGPEAHAFDDLRLMSACQHSILACSSFSWWGAWLNPHPSKVAIAPSPWFQDATWNSSDVVPERWMKLTREGELP